MIQKLLLIFIIEIIQTSTYSFSDAELLFIFIGFLFLINRKNHRGD